MAWAGRVYQDANGNIDDDKLIVAKASRNLTKPGHPRRERLVQALTFGGTGKESGPDQSNHIDAGMTLTAGAGRLRGMPCEKATLVHAHYGTTDFGQGEIRK